MSSGGFALAIAGAFISFLPLLQILLPIKAAEIAPGAPTTTLSDVAAFGAVIAGLANFVIGWLSDRTKTRFGRRQPWIIGGLLGVLPSYALLWWSHSVAMLFVAFACFQISFNTMFSPLLALVADRVPSEERGKVAGLMSLGTPVGTLVGTVVIGSVFLQEGYRFLALAGIVFLAIAPFALTLGPDPTLTPGGGLMPARSERLSGNFLLGCAARVCVFCAFTVAQIYILIFVKATFPNLGPRAVEAGVALLGTVFAIASSIAGLVLGPLSDRRGYRKPMAIFTGFLVGAGMAVLATASSWPTAIAGYAIFAIGAGSHTAVEFALMVDILPSPQRAARDLGILNLTNIVPQIIAPLSVAWIVSLPGATIHWGFAAGAMMAAIGAGLIGFMRSEP
jgi:MFS family permease